MNSISRLAAAFFAAALAGCATSVAPPSPTASPSTSPAAGPSPDSRGQAPLARSRAVAPSLADTDTEGPLPSIELSPQILFQLLAADLALQRREVGAAWSTYNTLARQTRDPRLARRATEIALAGRAMNEATQSARLWRELAPGSDRASQTLEALLLAGGQLPEVEPLLAARLAGARAAGTLAEAYPAVGRSLLRGADKAAGWQMLQRLSAPDLNVAHARITRAALAAAAKDDAAALTEAREAARLAPEREDIVVTAARQIAQSPKGLAEAMALLSAHLERQPDSLEARNLYARILLADGQAQAARAQFEQALARSPDNPMLLLALGQLAQQQRQPALAKRYIDQALSLPGLPPRERNQALMLRAQVAEDEGRTAEALDWLAKVPAGDDYLSALARRTALLGRTGQVDAARALLQQAEPGSNRDRLLLISAESHVLREAGRHQEAYEVLTRGLQQNPDQPELLYDHAMAAEKLDRLADMEASMRRLIELRPDHAHAYNALGYTLADRGLRLDEARSLIEKALALAPDDAHIMDSMGWVLFRQKDLTGAQTYLRRAYAMRPEADIAAHLGEVLWVGGQREEARRVWREARQREPRNTTLQDTLKRLNVAL